MNILLVSATKQEISPFLEQAVIDVVEGKIVTGSFNGNNIQVLITGVGIAQTAFYLGKHLTKSYDLVINAGICGSFNTHLKLGQVVQITEDYFADLGAEDGDKFLSVSELGLPAAYYVKNENPLPVTGVEQVRGVTVNTTHGNEESIRKFSSRIKADVESMEGAAFLWACNIEKVKCLQLRAISNYVEKRDRSKWQISTAIQNLNEVLIGTVEAI